MLIGYARVSTKRQRLDLQLKALEAAKCNMVVSEWLSGGAGIGKGLLAAIGSCRRGDTLVVWKLDRVSRNLLELMAVMDALRKRGVCLKVLTGAAAAIDINDAEGPALYTIYAAVAELERSMNRERTLAGIGTMPKRRPQSRKAKSTVGAGSRRVVPMPLRCAFNRNGRSVKIQ